MFFKSPVHQERLVSIMQDLEKIDQGRFDPEYASALYILTADPGTWGRVSEYVTRYGIDFDSMLQEVDFSSGYAALIRLAGNLFNSQQKVDPVDLATGLDAANFKLALTAMHIRRHNLWLEAFKSNAWAEFILGEEQC